MTATLLPRLLGQLAGTFYRVTVTGPAVPSYGPVLLVANHPSSLLDPALLMASTERPVRFLAKSTLFERAHTPAIVRWLVRAAGSIPVHRRQDGEVPAGALDTTFSAVHAAHLAGQAVALFPEGVSHTAPGLLPLKTGAARIALGTAEALGAPIPIIPIGLVLRDRAVFRSDALVVRGEPIRWADLLTTDETGRVIPASLRAVSHSTADAPAHPTAGAAPLPWAGADAEESLETARTAVVRELTARIAASLEAVTLNHESWDDADLVDFAEQVHATRLPVSPTPPERYVRQQRGAQIFTTLRRQGDHDWQTLAADLRRHRRVLQLVRLTPLELAAVHGRPSAPTADAAPASLDPAAAREDSSSSPPSPSSAPAQDPVAPPSAPPLPWGPFVARWLTLLTLGSLTAVGTALWAFPYRLTGVLAARFGARQGEDVLGTSKALLGALLFLLWTLLWAIVAGVIVGLPAALLVLLLLPLLAGATLVTAEGWQTAVEEGRLLLTRTFFRDRLAALATRQATLALQIEALLTTSLTPPRTPPPRHETTSPGTLPRA